jgi:hypothetical protein
MTRNDIIAMKASGPAGHTGDDAAAGAGRKNYDIPEEEVFTSGHNGCPGCGEALAMRYVTNTLGRDSIGVVPPSCIAILSGPQPHSSMKIPVYQTTLEASAASAAGIKRALLRQGNDHTTVFAMAGDGGTYDIGFQALSGAAERHEDLHEHRSSEELLDALSGLHHLYAGRQAERQEERGRDNGRPWHSLRGHRHHRLP